MILKACTDSSGLEQFTLDLVGLHDLRMADRPLLRYLDALQTCLLAFPALKSVRLVNRTPAMPTEFLRSSLPALQAKGLLRFNDEC